MDTTVNELLEQEAGVIEKTVTIKGRSKRRGYPPRVWINGQELFVERSWHIHRHSIKFAWGFEGSACSQLALAICLELFGDFGRRIYHDFRRQVITRLPEGEDFEIELNTEIVTRFTIQ